MSEISQMLDITEKKIIIQVLYVKLIYINLNKFSYSYYNYKIDYSILYICARACVCMCVCVCVYVCVCVCIYINCTYKICVVAITTLKEKIGCCKKLDSKIWA